jgi:predicted dehydrogenase
MEAPPARVGLVGYGLSGSAFHAPFIATTPGLRLSHIVTGQVERQAEARRAHPGATIVARADELWREPHAVDVVVIAAPNSAHVPLATAAVRAGVPVVVDKPLAASAADGRRLIEDAQRRGILLTVYQNRRWDGDFQTVRQLLADGRLGQPQRFESRFERWRPQPKPGWRERGAAGEAGGLLFDLGSHLIDQALQLFGPVSAVYAEVDRRRAGVEVDDDTFVALTHASGVRSHLWMSAVAAQIGPRFRLLGSRGAYVKYHLDPQEAELRRGAGPGGPGWGEESEDRWGRLGTDEASERVRTLPGAYGGFYRALAAALATGGPPPVDPADALAVLEIIEAAQRSDAERRVVGL